MKRFQIVWLAVILLLGPGCRGNRSLLPDGGELGGYSDLDSTENYPGSGLYAYMNGAAELYLEYGCSRLSVRRYGRASDRLVVELFEMRSDQEAAALYTYLRRPGTERDIIPGCALSVTPSEVLLSKGQYCLICRNEDPMVQDATIVLELCRRIAERLPGESSVETLFAALPVEARDRGSEVALRGPIALNVRPWLWGFKKDGFERGWMAHYNLPGGTAETLLAEFSGRDAAEQAVRALAGERHAGLVAEVKDRWVVVARGEGVGDDQLRKLKDRIFSTSR
jgi:hypothetical protein